MWVYRFVGVHGLVWVWECMGVGVHESVYGDIGVWVWFMVNASVCIMDMSV